MARPVTARPPPPPHKAPSQGRRGAGPGPLERLDRLLLCHCRCRRLLTTTTTWRRRPHRARSRDRAGPRAGARAHARPLSRRSGEKRAGRRGGGGAVWADYHAPGVSRVADQPSARGERGAGWEAQLAKERNGWVMDEEENQRWSHRFLGGIFS